MTLATQHRLVGLCVLAMITIAAFSIQMVVWSYTRMPYLKGIAVGAPFGQAVVALIAAVCVWKQKPIGYVLVVLVCALQNILTTMTHYTQPGPFGVTDVIDLGLAGLPLIVAILAAIGLLLQHYRSP
jgi:hypothetical protein